MNALARVLSAETLKLRGTLALRLCAIAPGLVVALSVLQLMLSKGAPMATPELAWERFAQGVLGLWAFLMLPLYITLQSALLAGLEHGERQWKHLLALPVPRGAHYLAKLVILIGMVLLALLLLALMIPVGGWVLMHVGGNQLGLDGMPSWEFIGMRVTAIFAASCFVIALHTWIALRWTSFTVAVAAGMSATVAGFLLAQSQRFGHWYPWSMPAQVMAGEGEKIGFVVIAGLIGGLSVAALGLWDFLRREYP